VQPLSLLCDKNVIFFIQSQGAVPKAFRIVVGIPIIYDRGKHDVILKKG